MTVEQIIIGTLAWAILISIVYAHSKWDKIK